MDNPMRTRRGRGWRSRRGLAMADMADEQTARRSVALALLAALLLMAGIFGLVHACSAHHPAHRLAARPSAKPGVPPYGLVGGGGVRPSGAAGKLAVIGSVGDVLFAEDGITLDSYAQAVINSAAMAIRARRPAEVIITGYTDAIGGAGTNQRLSLQRAGAVLRALRLRLGTTAIRYRTQARGQADPVASNATALGRQLNRRVVITISMQRHS